jgi:hypothetical protein
MDLHLFEVEVKNRVVKGGWKPRSKFKSIFDKDDADIRPSRFGVRKRKFRRIKGTQGGWYHETLHYLAESEVEAHKFASEAVAARRVLGIPRSTRRNIQRQVEILNVRRLA